MLAKKRITRTRAPITVVAGNDAKPGRDLFPVTAP